MLNWLGRHTAAQLIAGELSTLLARQMSSNLPIPSLAELHTESRLG